MSFWIILFFWGGMWYYTWNHQKWIAESISHLVCILVWRFWLYRMEVDYPKVAQQRHTRRPKLSMSVMTTRKNLQWIKLGIRPWQRKITYIMCIIYIYICVSIETSIKFIGDFPLHCLILFDYHSVCLIWLSWSSSPSHRAKSCRPNVTRTMMVLLISGMAIGHSSIWGKILGSKIGCYMPTHCKKKNKSQSSNASSERGIIKFRIVLPNFRCLNPHCFVPIWGFP